MEKKTILFDLDGTLVDTEEGVAKSLCYAMDKLGMEHPDTAVYRPLAAGFLPAGIWLYGGTCERSRFDFPGTL